MLEDTTKPTTPTPWEIDQESVARITPMNPMSEQRISIVGALVEVAQVAVFPDVPIANAELIVKAVNSYEKLVKALIIVFNADLIDGDLRTSHGYYGPFSDDRCSAAEIVLQALEMVDPKKEMLIESLQPGAFGDKS